MVLLLISSNNVIVKTLITRADYYWALMFSCFVSVKKNIPKPMSFITAILILDGKTTHQIVLQDWKALNGIVQPMRSLRPQPVVDEYRWCKEAVEKALSYTGSQWCNCHGVETARHTQWSGWSRSNDRRTQDSQSQIRKDSHGHAARHNHHQAIYHVCA